MAITLDDVVEAAAQGVLRALGARNAGKDSVDKRLIGATELVRSGFFVDVHIRCGGRPLPIEYAELNPQPLPPKAIGPTG